MFLKLFLSIFVAFSLFSNEPASPSEGTDVYLAGPLFTLAETQFNASLAERLRQLGYTVFLPQEVEQREVEVTAENIFLRDIGGIDNARAVVAVFDGSDPDSGACWECGYAYGKGKPTIAVRTDFRGVGDPKFAPYNLMLWESAAEHVQMPCLQYDFQSVTDAIDKALQFVLTKRTTSMKINLSVMPDRLAVCRLDASSDIPNWGIQGSDVFSITKTRDELSIVCLEANVPHNVKVEKGWRSIKVEGPLDFGLTGILFSLLKPLAEAKISIFAISTYDTDYILVKEDKLDDALEVLGTICKITQ